ncbi:MAG TPA: hypothetical protein VGL92_13105 [Acidimicrobiia bacterium]|jgi:hypothetical protein
MALSEYEEFVVAELEAQFQADAPPAPRRDLGRLALPVICLLGGVALLVAAHQVGLVIRISDFWGFSTSSVTSSLALTGYGLLLGSAFLFGHVLHELRPPRPGCAGMDRPAVSRERV